MIEFLFMVVPTFLAVTVHNSAMATASKKGKSKSRHTYDVGLLKMTFGNSSFVD